MNKKTRFDQFHFQPFIQLAIDKLGFYEPTEVQQKLIPAIMKGESVVGQSQTGTGKTHTFLLPIINKIRADKDSVQAVITAPSRELATQIHNEIKKLIKYSDDEIRSLLVIGGTDKQRTIDRLKKQQPHIVVGTPGRINDLIRETALLVHTTQVFVIDEADMTLDMGFLMDVDQIASKMPESLQMLVFSATIPQKLKPFLKKYMENPRYEHIQPQALANTDVKHQLIARRSKDKMDILKNALVAYQPYLAVVFTNTKAMADEVAKGLTERGLKVAKIHGGVEARERKRTMKQLESLEYQYVVATDLAARGIDIQGISHIINYELPSDLDFYIHRTGRTGRAGHSGVALTIYEPSDEDALNQLEKMNIEFKHVDLKNGEFVDADDRNRRQKREAKREAADPREIGMRKKAKEKGKPNYKKKLNYKMNEIKRRERKMNKRGR